MNKFIGIYSKQEKSFCINKVKNVFHKILIIKYLCEYFCDRNLMLQKSKEKNPKNFHLRKTKHRKNTMMIELPEIKLNKEDHKNNAKNKRHATHEGDSQLQRRYSPRRRRRAL